jgi:hypothetical protein
LSNRRADGVVFDHGADVVGDGGPVKQSALFKYNRFASIAIQSH